MTSNHWRYNNKIYIYIIVHITRNDQKKKSQKLQVHIGRDHIARQPENTAKVKKEGLEDGWK